MAAIRTYSDVISRAQALLNDSGGAIWNATNLLPHLSNAQSRVFSEISKYSTVEFRKQVVLSYRAGDSDLTAFLPADLYQPERLEWSTAAIVRIAASPTGAVRATNVVTITTTTDHGLVAGDSVLIGGVTDTSFNGTFTVATAPTGTTFTYAQTAANASSGGGTATKQTPTLSEEWQEVDRRDVLPSMEVAADQPTRVLYWQWRLRSIFVGKATGDGFLRLTYFGLLTDPTGSGSSILMDNVVEALAYFTAMDAYARRGQVGQVDMMLRMGATQLDNLISHIVLNEQLVPRRGTGFSGQRYGLGYE